MRIHSDLTQVSKPFTNNKASLDKESTKSG